MRLDPNQDYYAVLQLGEDASDLEVKAAYRRLARRDHPDVGGSADRMKQITEAYHVLSRPVLRATYDFVRWRPTTSKSADRAQPRSNSGASSERDVTKAQHLPTEDAVHPTEAGSGTHVEARTDLERWAVIVSVGMLALVVIGCFAFLALSEDPPKSTSFRDRMSVVACSSGNTGPYHARIRAQNDKDFEVTYNITVTFTDLAGNPVSIGIGTLESIGAGQWVETEVNGWNNEAGRQYQCVITGVHRIS